MSNELDKTGNNPFSVYGNSVTARAIVGLLLKFTKGDYFAGMDNKPVPLGTRLVAIMDSLMIGWVKWENNVPAEQQMGPVAEGYQPCRREGLGDADENQWELDDRGDPRDPWQLTNYLLLATPDKPDDLYTFATGSKGGISAIGELSKVYGKLMRQKPDQYPVVELGCGSYQHSNKQYGRIRHPTLPVVDWTDKGPFLEGGGVSSNGPAGDGGGAIEPPAPDTKPAAAKSAAKPDSKPGARKTSERDNAPRF